MLDYTIWDLRQHFTCEEAAILWFDVNPLESKSKLKRLPDPLKLKMKEMFALLEEAAKKGKITGITRPPGLPLEISSISRNGLIDYALRLKQRPLFLFPEKRASEGSPLHIE